MKKKIKNVEKVAISHADYIYIYILACYAYQLLF